MDIHLGVLQVTVYATGQHCTVSEAATTLGWRQAPINGRRDLWRHIATWSPSEAGCSTWLVRFAELPTLPVEATRPFPSLEEEQRLSEGVAATFSSRQMQDVPIAVGDVQAHANRYDVPIDTAVRQIARRLAPYDRWQLLEVFPPVENQNCWIVRFIERTEPAPYNAALSHTPSDSGNMVFINGIRIADGQYSVQGHMITFDEAPRSGDVIQVTFANEPTRTYLGDGGTESFPVHVDYVEDSDRTFETQLYGDRDTNQYHFETSFADSRVREEWDSFRSELGEAPASVTEQPGRNECLIVMRRILQRCTRNAPIVEISTISFEADSMLWTVQWTINPDAIGIVGAWTKPTQAKPKPKRKSSRRRGEQTDMIARGVPDED